jgi:hypothetical protein
LRSLNLVVWDNPITEAAAKMGAARDRSPQFSIAL